MTSSQFKQVFLYTYVNTQTLYNNNMYAVILDVNSISMYNILLPIVTRIYVRLPTALTC